MIDSIGINVCNLYVLYLEGLTVLNLDLTAYLQ